MIGQISKISKHNKAKDWHKDDLILQREALKLEMERAKKHLRKKAKELGLELEGVQFKKEKRREDSLAAGIMSEKARKSSGVEKLAKKSRRMTMMTPDGQIRSRYSFSKNNPWNESNFVFIFYFRSPGPRDLQWSLPITKTTLFVKFMDAQAYMPVVLNEKTVECLLDAIHKKCPKFEPGTVTSLYKKTAKGIVFHLDDDMMDFIENQQIFNIEIKEGDDDKTDMILEEVHT